MNGSKVNIDRYRNLKYGEIMEIANAQTEPHKRGVFLEYAAAVLESMKNKRNPILEVRENSGLGYRLDYEEMLTATDGECSILQNEVRIYRSLVAAETEMNNSPVWYSQTEVMKNAYAAIGAEYHG